MSTTDSGKRAPMRTRPGSDEAPGRACVRGTSPTRRKGSVMSPVPTAPAGVTVVVCDGQRCHALRDRTDTGVADIESASLLGALRERVCGSQYGVLTRSGCLGVCAQAPAVLLVHLSSPRFD